MKLYFSNEDYKRKALEIKTAGVSKHSVGDAFLLLVKDLPKEDLSNLTKLIKEHFYSKQLSLEDCYDLTQGNSAQGIIIDEKLKSTLVDLAYKCIESGKPLGERTINNGKINTSSWMGHVLYGGKVAKELATKLGLDSETAQIRGILHDYGRKITHSFEHVTKGYEKLIDEGWEEEAIACLTHSFLNGGRCASNENAEEGFYVDENGNPSWKDGTEKDDVTVFLENYKYNEYDDVLNIMDLMATSSGIVSPYERIEDIATRRTLDPTNRGYFLAEFTNKLVEFLEKTGAKVPENIREEIKATPDISIDEINDKFKNVSDIFYEYYKKEISSDKTFSQEEIKDLIGKTTSKEIMDTQKAIIKETSKKMEENERK